MAEMLLILILVLECLTAAPEAGAMHGQEMESSAAARLLHRYQANHGEAGTPGNEVF